MNAPFGLPGTPLYPSDPINRGLEGWWPMWEGAGGKILDISGNNNHGALTNGPIWTGRGLSFDGVNDYVDPSKVLNVPYVTVSAWIKIVSIPTSNGRIAGFLNGFGGAAWDKELYIDAEGKLRFYVYDGVERITSVPSNAIPLNQWVHVAGTANGLSARAYVNGVEVGSVAAGATYTGYTVPNVYIQGTDGTAGYIAVSIKGVRVHNRALSALEIQRLYVNPNAGLWTPDYARYYVAAAAIQKAIIATASSTARVLKSTTKKIAATASNAPSILRTATKLKTIVAAAASAARFVRVTHKNVLATVSSVVRFVRSTQKKIVAAAGTSVLLLKGTPKTIVATAGSAVTFTKQKLTLFAQSIIVATGSTASFVSTFVPFDPAAAVKKLYVTMIASVNRLMTRN